MIHLRLLAHLDADVAWVSSERPTDIGSGAQHERADLGRPMFSQSGGGAGDAKRAYQPLARTHDGRRE